MAERLWRAVVWDLRTGNLVGRQRLWAHFSHVIFPGFRPFKHGWEWTDHPRPQSRLPRRISNRDNALRRHYWAFRVKYPRPTTRKSSTVQAPTEVPCVHLDHDRSLGIVNRDGPLIVDPTQGIFVVDFARTSREPRVFLILRTQPLIECAYSRRAGIRTSWNELRRDAVVMEVPFGDILSPTVVHGARLMTLNVVNYGPEGGHRIHAFDFSRRGFAALRLSDGDDGGTWRRAAFEDGFVSEGHEELGLRKSPSLGDSVAFSVVSLFSCSARAVS